MKYATKNFMFLFFVLLATGCGNSGSGNSGSGNSADFTTINGAGVKGPLAGATVQLYQVDLSQTNLKGTLLSEGSTGSDAAINNLTIENNLSGLLLLEFIVDADTVEINTGNAPVFDSLVTVFDVQRVYDGDSIYASPLTTMAVSLAQSKADSSSPYIGNNDVVISEAEFIAALGVAQNQTKSTVGFGLDTTVDIFVVSPMITSETDTTAEQTAVVKYRQAIEALAAVTQQIAADSSTTSDSAQTIFDALIEDLEDGDIDGQNDAGAVGTLLALDVPIETTLAAVNLNALLIPGTSTPVTDIETELATETTVTGETVDTTDLEDGTIDVILEAPELIADIDGDGVGDNSDAFPNDATETVDTDSDGVGDNADAFPNDATETTDTDSDGVGDNSDAFPSDVTETVDTDSDGMGDNSDVFPTDPTETTDSDSDGVGDNADTFPLDATESADSDSDGVGDNADAFPTDATETMDSDGDGVGDNADVFPLDINETLDTDINGIGDNAQNCPTCDTFKASTAFFSFDKSTGGIRQADGKIVVAGETYNNNSYDIAVVRFNADGSLDTTFNTDGKLTYDIGGNHDRSGTVIQQADGKLVVVGRTQTAFSEPYNTIVFRLNTDGSIDNTFGSSGLVSLSVGSVDNIITDVIQQSDNKIVITGSANNGLGHQMLLIRLNTDGSLDTSFDSDGIVTVAVGSVKDFSNEVVQQADGKLVVAGSTEDLLTGYSDIALLRFNLDGSLDTNFDTDGIVTSSFGSLYDTATSLIVQADGKYTITGVTRNSGDWSDVLLARYNTDGTLDNSFGTDGIVVTDIGNIIDGASDIIQQDDGKLVVVGHAIAPSTPNFSSMAFMRYNTDGSLDDSIVGNASLATGAVIIYPGITSSDSSASSVIRLSTGRYILIGNSTTGFDSDFTIVGVHHNGALCNTCFATP